MSDPPSVDVRAVLEARARKLASVPAATRGREDLRSYLCFSVGEERMAIDIAVVGAFLQAKAIIPLPDAPPALRGLVHHEGKVLAVVAIEALFGATPRPRASASLVVLAPPYDDLALAVGEEQGIVELERPAGAAKSGIVAFTLEDGRSVLDARALGEDPRTSFPRRTTAAAPRKE